MVMLNSRFVDPITRHAQSLLNPILAGEILRRPEDFGGTPPFLPSQGKPSRLPSPLRRSPSTPGRFGGSATPNAREAGPTIPELILGQVRRLGPVGRGVDRVLSPVADFAGEVGEAGRRAARTGALAGLAPDFTAGVLRGDENRRADQMAELQRQLIESQLNPPAVDPLSQVPGAVLAKMDPQSVVEAFQTGDIGKLRGIGADAGEINDEVDRLADDVRAESKDFNLQKEAYGRIQASAADPSPAGDLALIFNFMKVLDPGSTVREGEFANAQNSGSVPQKVRALYNSVTEGTRLTEEQRNDFLRRSQRLFNSAVEGQQERNQRFRTRGQNAGIPDAFIDPLLPGADLVDVLPGVMPDEALAQPPLPPLAGDEKPEGRI